MLDTIRAHALERLAVSGAEADARRAHLRWAADAADAVWRRRHAYPDGGITLLRAEQDNYRSALAWAERDDPATGLRLAVALELLWLLGGRYHEGRRWFSALLEAAPEAPPSLRADAHRVQGRLSTYIGETSAAAGYYADGLRLARELGDRRIVANCLAGLAGAASELGDHEAVQPALEEAILLMQAEAADRPEDRDIANDLRWCRDTLGSMHLAAGRLDDARRAFDDMLRSARDYDDVHDIGYAIRRLADVSRAEGDLGAARAGYEEALVIQRELDDHNCIANTLFGLAALDEADGALTAAQERLHETASLRELLGLPWQVTECLERLAAIAGAEGRFARAARLLGASHLARAAAPERQASPSTAATALEEAARNQLGASEYRTEWLRGRATGWRAVTAE